MGIIFIVVNEGLSIRIVHRVMVQNGHKSDSEWLVMVNGGSFLVTKNGRQWLPMMVASD